MKSEKKSGQEQTDNLQKKSRKTKTGDIKEKSYDANIIDKLIEQMSDQVYERVNSAGGASESELFDIMDELFVKEEYKYVPLSEKEKLRRELYNSIKRLDVLQDILDDDSVTEIMINGYDAIFIEREGRISRYEKNFASRDKLLDVVQRIAGKTNKIVNESTPIIDTRLEDGSRVNIVMNPIAMDGPAVTIRKFYDNPLTIDRLIEIGAISEQASLFLEELVRARYNIFISGGTGSGKTTFLNALSNYIPKNERIITIEDSAELKLIGIDNLVRLEARNANSEGKNEVTIRDMIKASLRMRPSRIVVGEVRGGEALDMLQAMNTGHDGSLSTGHANGPQEMLLRLETMVLMATDMPVEAIRKQIASAIDIIVHLGRLYDGSRKVLSICEVAGIDSNGISEKIELNTLYEYVMEGEDDEGRIEGELRKTQNTLINTQKLLQTKRK